MFEALNERLTGVFDRITGRGALSEKDVSEAMREVRVALLEADVALPVVKDFIAFATERAIPPWTGRRCARRRSAGPVVLVVPRRVRCDEPARPTALSSPPFSAISRRFRRK